MDEKKQEFIDLVKQALISDKCSLVEEITYEKRYAVEIITIRFRGGHTKRIDVTANSNGANYREIGRAVYGSGARGEIHGK